MKVLETDFWCLLLPPEWTAEKDDDVVVIVDDDDVGELSLTTLCKQSGEVEGSDVLSMARDESPEVKDWKNVSVGAFVGVGRKLLRGWRLHSRVVRRRGAGANLHHVFLR